jgi:hypothetical protein
MVVKGLTTDRCLTAVYYHNLLGKSFWVVEGYKIHFSNLNSFNLKEIEEVDRSKDMKGFVNMDV